MSNRHNKIGIQRELYLQWFDHAALVYSSGYTKTAARQELYSYLDNAVGFITSPSNQTKTYIANVLIKTWIAPDKELVPLRDMAHTLLNSNSCSRSAVHWALLCAAYPFWYNVASRVGRLLNLQDQVTQSQIVLRLKETYGDRQTVSRRARYVIRSLVNWNVLRDSKEKGCYEKVLPVVITDLDLSVFMLEAALYASPEDKQALSLLLNNPAFFPFQLPVIVGDYVSQHTERVEVDRYGLDDEYLRLSSRLL
jgi:hypothetical protein